MKRATYHFEAFAVVITQLATAMHAGIRKCFHLIRRGSYDHE